MRYIISYSEKLLSYWPGDGLFRIKYLVVLELNLVVFDGTAGVLISP